jgi:signal transduction histidine kinase
MIVVSLKIVLLGGLLILFCITFVFIKLYVRVAAEREPTNGVATMLKALPLSALIFKRGQLHQSNALSQHLLTLHPDLEPIISQLSLEIADQSLVRRGVLTLPCPLHWWATMVDQHHVLFILVETADQQALIARQQVFIGQLSHELRTPLTALTTHAEIALREQVNRDVVQTSLHIIQRETQRSARLVRDLTELYRLDVCEQLAMRKANVVLIAEAAIAQIILEAEKKGQQLHFKADVGLSPVWVDPDRMTQVFLNLLQNAVTHISNGDTITVNLLQQGDVVLCEVADTGPGIAAAELPLVMEPLYRAQTKSEGSGLGLAIVSAILRQHGTSLAISSTTEGPQTGTICRWKLPALPLIAKRKT